ncbi:DUF2637 domain-containing protein [Streptomyces sp. NPDC048629]|uniref:DUF2637 domain-containing protein n=1 Tax=Streptomyces sp. NPDC048629 TaxID=3154824 RepID=UPI00342B08E5
MKNINPSRALAIGAGVVIIGLTGAAFWLSYAHLAEVALGHGLGAAPARAWAWPATLDLFIVAGELLMLRAAMVKKVDPWAIGLTAVGSLGSIILNVAGVTGSRDPSTVPILDYVVAAVPPTAALLAFGALMRQIHQALAGRDEVTTFHAVETAAVTVERADLLDNIRGVPAVGSVTAPVIALPAASPLWHDWSTSKVTTPARASRQYRLDSFAEQYVPVDDTGPVAPQAAAVPAEQPRQVVTEQIALTPTELRKKARTLNRQVVRSGGRGVTIDQLRDEFGLSRRDATQLRRDVVSEVAS